MKLNLRNSQKELTDATARLLVTRLQNKPTNLFVSGGSSFAVFRALNDTLPLAQKKLITLFQVDERYGEPNHTDSNAKLLLELDLHEYAGYEAILSGLGMIESVSRYQEKVDTALSSIDINIAILGYGSDSHIAGIKSMAQEDFVKTFAGKVVAGYRWTDYQRITLTPEALTKFDALIAFGYGADKKKVVEGLDIDMPLHESPMHILRQPPEVEVFYTENKE